MRRDSIVKNKKIALIGMLIALAFIFSYLEAILPIHLGIPGAKIGLANLVVIVALFTIGEKEALCLSFIRIILTGFLFGGMSQLIFSLAGGIVSYSIMWIAKRSHLFSVVGVSILGGLSHNIAQLIVAIWVVKTSGIISYLPFLLLFGSIAGFFIGLLGGLIIKRLSKIQRNS